MKSELEEWRPVVGYEGLYEVSSLGYIRSLGNWDSKGSRGKVRILKNVDGGRGYQVVTLWKNHKHLSKRVHRLVAEAFLPNPDNLPEINHKDEDKTNNRVENLEWCTKLYNAHYGTRNQRCAETQKNNPNRSKSVAQFDIDGNLVRIWPSLNEVSRSLGYNLSFIWKCCNNIRPTAYGCTWKYC